jgi:hypothetical protein
MGLKGGVAGLVGLNLYCVFWFVLKAMGLVFVQMWLRWTLPRIRIDQVLYACVKVLLPLSIVAFAGTALWVWLVDSPAAYPAYRHVSPVRLGHLTHHGTGLQMVTQIVLTVLGVAVFLYCAGIVVYAFLTRRKHPPQTFFPDVMPVGNQESFTPGNREIGLENSPKPQGA